MLLILRRLNSCDQQPERTLSALHARLRVQGHVMPSHSDTVSKVSFGVFEADLQTGELWKAGRRVKLQSQPFRVLTCLIERAGGVVSRDELQQRVWGPDTVVDFDHSIGTAINKIRDALGDTADNPRFVETLAKRGYRFIAPVAIRTAALETSTSTMAESVGESGSAGMTAGAVPLGVASSGFEVPSVPIA